MSLMSPLTQPLRRHPSTAVCIARTIRSGVSQVGCGPLSCLPVVEKTRGIDVRLVRQSGMIASTLTNPRSFGGSMVRASVAGLGPSVHEQVHGGLMVAILCLLRGLAIYRKVDVVAATPIRQCEGRKEIPAVMQASNQRTLTLGASLVSRPDLTTPTDAGAAKSSPVHLAPGEVKSAWDRPAESVLAGLFLSGPSGFKIVSCRAFPSLPSMLGCEKRVA